MITLERLRLRIVLIPMALTASYFGGMTAEERATVLSIPLHVFRRELRLAQAWLRRYLAG
jgi:DNA-directed RNA polymerase specialized sigma24 family protein